MKKINLTQAVTVLANLGVIMGIVFLAFELRQNSEVLAFQARSTVQASRNLEQLSIATNEGGLGDIIDKSLAGEPLTRAESMRISVFASLAVHNYELMFIEVKNGLLSQDDLPIAQWTSAPRTPHFHEFWVRTRHRYDSDFVQYVEENIPSLLAEPSI